MHLSKKERRVILNCVEEGRELVDALETDWALPDRHYRKLEKLYEFLCLIGMRLEKKRGKRRHERGLQKARRAEKTALGRIAS